MTEHFPAPTTAPGGFGYPQVDDDASAEPAGTVDIAKDEAAQVGQNVAEAGQHVVGVAKDQAQNVIAEAGSQAKDLLGQARTELADQAGQQQQRLAASLHTLGDELHSMAHHSEQPGVATDLARQGSSRAHDAASWLESREPGHLVEDVKSFARQRPGTFLLAALGAGLLAGRLTRSVKDASSEDSDSQPDALSPSTPKTTAVPAIAPGALATPDALAAVPTSFTSPEFPLLGDDR